MKSLKRSAWAILLTVLLVQGLTFLWAKSYLVAEAKPVDQNRTQLRAQPEDALPKFDVDEPAYPAPGEPSDPPPDEPGYPAPDEAPPREPGRYLTGPNEGQPLEIAETYIEENAGALQLVADDLDDVVVNDQYVSQEGENQVTHIYLRQRFEGIEVAGADININIASDGSVINIGNRFVENLDQAITQNLKTISAIEATELAAEELGLTITEPIEVQGQFQGPEDEVVLSDGGISLQEIPAKLVYQPLENGEVHLAWDLQIYETSAQNYWNVQVDAASGTLLEQVNWVTHDNWGPIAQPAQNNTPLIADDQPVEAKIDNDAPLNAPQYEYRVYAAPVETPNHGSRTIESNPSDPFASPFGWHDRDGIEGADSNHTVGNNVDAYQDTNNSNSPTGGDDARANGGPDLVFDSPIDLEQAPNSYQDATITNLFYWNNIIHDIFYQYGFDEASGNFQENNYGKGGLASDGVNAEAQDGGGMNNANFATLPDGSNPRMQMYLWSQTSPQRDGDFDNGIIMHEYGHGISNRLTGGPNNTSCLWNAEQGGEGWSDWFALMMTMQAGAQGSDGRGIGTYVLGQLPDGRGIRPAPYSTDMEINNYTYGDIGGQRIPHGVGFIWGTMLWEVNWALIDQYGWDADLYNGTGGNNIALQLVMDGLKLQPCSPGFVDARDAILLADMNNNDGVNQCVIWEAFAKRGLGFSAEQGSSYSTVDGTEAFDLPPSCQSDVRLSLPAGWNLISIPIQPDDSDIEDMLSSITDSYDIVYAYDACDAEELWKKYDPNGPPFANTLTTGNEKMGLWVHMTKADILALSGTEPEQTTISLCNEWNLIGYPSAQTRELPNALDSIDGKYTLVNAYNVAESPSWQKFDPNGPPFANSLLDMQANFGYWINVNDLNGVELIIDY